MTEHVSRVRPIVGLAFVRFTSAYSKSGYLCAGGLKVCESIYDSPEKLVHSVAQKGYWDAYNFPKKTCSL